jgi:hypothetical protein
MESCAGDSTSLLESNRCYVRLKRNLLIPRTLILDSKVWRGSPSFRAAPFGPPILPADSAPEASVLPAIADTRSVTEIHSLRAMNL